MSNKETFISNLEALKDYLSVVNDEKCINLLDETLDKLLSEDAFGTEGQSDPRGDQRESEWEPYDEEDEDSDGEYSYIKVGDWYSPTQVVQNLINYIKNQDYEEWVDDMANSFEELFKIFGLNEQRYREQLENEERESYYMNNLYNDDTGFSQF